MRRILVVDDSPMVRLVVRRALESLGFTVDEAADGQQALDRCRAAGPPDGIILDIIMPVLDGIGFLRAMRQDERLQRSTVVVCTTRNEPHEIQEAIALGASEYIMKPFTNEILADKLKQVGLLE